MNNILYHCWFRVH